MFNAIASPDTKGLVIEGLGAGNLPPATLPAIEKLLALRIPIVLVSRCYNGVAQDIYDYEGGGIELTKMGLILCQGLNGQKARIDQIVSRIERRTYWSKVKRICQQRNFVVNSK